MPINTIPGGLDGGFSGMLKMTIKFIAGGGEHTPNRSLSPFITDTSVYNTPPQSRLHITWLGHSGLLLEIDGIRIPIEVTGVPVITNWW